MLKTQFEAKQIIAVKRISAGDHHPEGQPVLKFAFVHQRQAAILIAFASRFQRRFQRLGHLLPDCLLAGGHLYGRVHKIIGLLVAACFLGGLLQIRDHTGETFVHQWRDMLNHRFGTLVENKLNPFTGWFQSRAFLLATGTALTNHGVQRRGIASGKENPHRILVTTHNARIDRVDCFTIRAVEPDLNLISACPGKIFLEFSRGFTGIAQQQSFCAKIRNLAGHGLGRPGNDLGTKLDRLA
jgi:hypothetical protein